MPGAALQLPLWLAPNLITLMGTMALVASYLTSAYYTPDFVGEAAAAAAAAMQPVRQDSGAVWAPISHFAVLQPQRQQCRAQAACIHDTWCRPVQQIASNKFSRIWYCLLLQVTRRAGPTC